MIFVNFKTFQEGTGETAVKLAKICQKVSQATSLEIIPLVQATDLSLLANQGLKVWAQHVDDISFGPHTGQVLPQAVKASGAKGTLLNHSENKLPSQVIGSTIKSCQALALKTLVCAESIEEAKEIALFKPNLLAYEPPELIGSRTVSVATIKPEVISEFTQAIKEIPILVGAGIHSQKDVKISLQLGAKGILVATDIVLAEDPEKELIDLAKGFK